ncbi:MAG: penicillin-binding protein 2 [Candidatus Aminicenantes bacterium]|nr:penicillin-binding protein 2 [Candidatus Aminicenantes bacterium]
MKINRNERNRAFIVFMMFVGWILIIGVTLIKTQVFHFTKYLARIKAQSHRILSLNPKRGTIYDCQGEVLAISVKAKSAFLNNKNRYESERIFSRINKVISINNEKRRNIEKRIKRGDNFIWLKRKLGDKEYDILNKIQSTSRQRSIIGFIDEYKRIYPQKETAAHILGGVGIDEQGLYGIEFALDKGLKGKGGEVEVLVDARRKVFNYQYLDQPVSGRDVYLTIDSTVQFFIEKELKKVIKKFKAKGGSVIVMNSRDGSLIAMASYPTYNPDRLRYTSGRVLKNYAISFLYDPGSTFKIILASSALENSICYPQQIFDCYNGSYRIHNRQISDVHSFNKLTFEDIIIKSSNIGAVRVGLRVGKVKYFKTINDFGFGSKTGIGLSAEESGILNPLDKWTLTSIASLSFGYEISVTPIQMLRAFNVIATGGHLFTPRLLMKVGQQLQRSRENGKILSTSTCQKMLSIMIKVVNQGTGKKAMIEGLTIAGKTGTAQKIKRGKYEKIYVSSFGGFFPAQNPVLTMYVVIDEPKGKIYGGDVAAPLFKLIAQRLMIYMGIFPEIDGKNEIRI